MGVGVPLQLRRNCPPCALQEPPLYAGGDATVAIPKEPPITTKVSTVMNFAGSFCTKQFATAPRRNTASVLLYVLTAPITPSPILLPTETLRCISRMIGRLRLSRNQCPTRR